MGKTRKNKKRKQTQKRMTLESKTSKGRATKSDVNEFEWRRNKVKHNVMGRRVAKNELGRPGVSRAKAMRLRRDTLLPEYVNRHRSGRGVEDLRLKESDGGVVARKAMIYKSDKLPNEDNVVLTHGGHGLSYLENDRIGSDEEDVDLFERADFVETAHFGGFGETPKSANDVLNHIMDEKRAKQLENEANIELTQKLDKDWISVRNIVRHKGVKHESSNNVKDDYDMLVKQLMFEDSHTTNAKPIVIQKSDKLENEEQSVKKSMDTLFKESIEKLMNETDFTTSTQIFTNLVNNLLPQITEKSLNILREEFQVISESKNGFTLTNILMLMIGINLKQTKLMVQIILIDILSKIKYNSFIEIAQMLVIVRLLINTSNGKYMPEVVNAISNIISLSEEKEFTELTFNKRLNYSFKCILALNGKTSSKQIPVFKFKDAFNQTNELFDATTVKLKYIKETLKISEKLIDIYSSFPSFNEIFELLKNKLSLLPIDAYPSDLQLLINSIKTNLDKEIPKIVLHESRPKPVMLPMIEPKIDDKYSLSDKRRLQRKYKRELKGAQRELRKDSVFMRNTWLNETLTNDAKRKSKVKELMSELADQQHQFKKKRR